MYSALLVYRREGHKGPFWRFFTYSCHTRFFLHIVHRSFFVAEIQRRIVLKFQIFQIISFEDIIVQSWSGLKLNFAENAGHDGPLELRC